ncbi:MAG: YcgN family cysteine cluster protein [Pseudomonadota bacterium]
MAETPRPFWEAKRLEEMTSEEWEALCDGCAKCCLIKLEDEDTGEIALTGLHCTLLDADTCRCSDYQNRKQHVPDCVILTPKDISELRWMPTSCAYRLIHEGKPLPDWHHLISGDRDLIHHRGGSIMGRTLSEDTLFDPDDVEQIEAWIVDWEGNEP